MKDLTILLQNNEMPAICRNTMIKFDAKWLSLVSEELPHLCTLFKMMNNTI